MRIIGAVFLAASTLLGTSQAGAQTYDPAYPICLQSYGIQGNSISCRFGSMAQCQLSASGRAAQCVTNPYFGKAYRRR